MIKDDLLAERLNAVKNGKPLPKPLAQSQNIISTNNKPNNIFNKQDVILKILSLIDSFGASFLYGYAINTIFNCGWNILGVFAVGFLFNHSICIFPKILFPKFFKQ